MKKILKSLSAIFLSVTLVNAQIPPLINMQGRLTDPNGINRPDGSVNIIFRIWDQPTGGTTPLRAETQVVSVRNGIFQAFLGQGTGIQGLPLEQVFDGQDRFLEIQVENDPPMVPRQKMVSVPFALKAERAESLGNNAVVVSPAGNVGIGTTNPAYKLHVEGPARVGGGSGTQLTVEAGDGDPNQGGQILMKNTNSGVPNPQKFLRVAGGGEFQVVNNAYTAAILSISDTGQVFLPGSVGIGTTNPVVKLDVVGTGNYNQSIYSHATDNGITRFGLLNSVRHWSISGLSNGKFQIADENLAAVRVAIDTDGNVGIGTDTPQAKLHVIGSIVSCIKNFQISHPLNNRKLLLHGSVEAPELGLIYRGKAQLVNGEAIVQLPDYFESLAAPEDRTVQLTCQNGYSPMYVDGEVRNGQFRVRTTPDGKPSQEFFWMVQGKRNDPYSQAHPFQLVKDKPVEQIRQEEWNAMTPEERQLREWNAIIEVVP